MELERRRTSKQAIKNQSLGKLKKDVASAVLEVFVHIYISERVNAPYPEHEILLRTKRSSESDVALEFDIDEMNKSTEELKMIR